MRVVCAVVSSSVWIIASPATMAKRSSDASSVIVTKSPIVATSSKLVLSDTMVSVLIEIFGFLVSTLATSACALTTATISFPAKSFAPETSISTPVSSTPTSARFQVLLNLSLVTTDKSHAAAVGVTNVAGALETSLALSAGNPKITSVPISIVLSNTIVNFRVSPSATSLSAT